MPLNRFSSRRQKLHQSFLTDRLTAAKSYDRIAGYFSSSILEIAGEALESLSGQARIVCNSDLQHADVETARAANYAMRREWCASQPERLSEACKPRFTRLYEFLKSEKLKVRVVPNEIFGLIHGKAGVITLANGNKTCFIGSANETRDAWKLNYELIWEDDSEEAVQWVQEEFDALWNNASAVDLADFVIEDINRIAKRLIIPDIDSWRTQPDPAVPIIETPIFRREYGLWAHQKYFVNLAFEAHKSPLGARLILADMVGLGKTLQLAMSALLMALYGEKPILILAPKPLLWQWQDEMRNQLDMPSAVWTGKQWVDEQGIEYPVSGPESIKRCPRRVGIVSQGLITSRSPAADYLQQISYECVIVDEAHRARRRNLGPNRENETPDANNLLSFLLQLSHRTRSMLLATATPVQMYPIEAWDLLNILSQGNEFVLGNDFSNWRRMRKDSLELVMAKSQLPNDDLDAWNWIRNPLPPPAEGRDFEIIRRSLKISDYDSVAPGDSWDRLRESDKSRLRWIAPTFCEHHNPFIRHIVRRTREYLESTLDPETNEPYLKPVRVELLGESDDEAIRLPPYLRDAYTLAEEFCKLLGHRIKGSGFLKTLLLRRVGSTIYAGMNTAKSMLSSWQNIEEEEEDREENAEPELKSLTPSERDLLQRFVETLEANQVRDPKYEVIIDLLIAHGWLKSGSIIFSQYFDSIWWLANQLSSEQLPDELIAIYAGGQKSGLMQSGIFTRIDRDELKRLVTVGRVKILLGTDAASEGLNLQRLGTLINLDLPWNPTRLEQRKGRIQRIGQIRDTVYVYNMRYLDSVEDRVHHLLSGRLQNIYRLFGQLPDVLEDVWIDVAMGEIERAKQTIDAIPQQHPFEIKYHHVRNIGWESCSEVLNEISRAQHLRQPW